jgi:16S rRNA (uracil1498-N3)-methyltransferase
MATTGQFLKSFVRIMSLSRFYLAPLLWQAETLVFSGDEAAHCSRVLRRQIGDPIEVFDGAGRVATATITALSKNAVHATVEAIVQHEPRGAEVHLLPAMIKAEPFEWLLEKATELGASSVRPVMTQRSVVQLSGDQLEKKWLKWQRHMIESAKHCHTPWLPHLERPADLKNVLSSLPAEAFKVMPALTQRTCGLHDLSFAGQTSVFALIGPEGDFTSEEEALAEKHGFLSVTLGPLILRAETAAITTLAILAHELRRSLTTNEH